MAQIVGRLRLPRLAEPPLASQPGEMYFDTTLDTARFKGEDEWKEGGGAGGGETSAPAANVNLFTAFATGEVLMGAVASPGGGTQLAPNFRLDFTLVEESVCEVWCVVEQRNPPGAHTAKAWLDDVPGPNGDALFSIGTNSINYTRYGWNGQNSGGVVAPDYGVSKLVKLSAGAHSLELALTSVSGTAYVRERAFIVRATPTAIVASGLNGVMLLLDPGPYTQNVPTFINAGSEQLEVPSAGYYEVSYSGRLFSASSGGVCEVHAALGVDGVADTRCGFEVYGTSSGPAGADPATFACGPVPFLFDGGEVLRPMIAASSTVCTIRDIAITLRPLVVAESVSPTAGLLGGLSFSGQVFNQPDEPGDAGPGDLWIGEE